MLRRSVIDHRIRDDERRPVCGIGGGSPGKVKDIPLFIQDLRPAAIIEYRTQGKSLITEVRRCAKEVLVVGIPFIHRVGVDRWQPRLPVYDDMTLRIAVKICRQNLRIVLARYRVDPTEAGRTIIDLVQQCRASGDIDDLGILIREIHIQVEPELTDLDEWRQVQVELYPAVVD